MVEIPNGCTENTAYLGYLDPASPLATLHLLTSTAHSSKLPKAEGEGSEQLVAGAGLQTLCCQESAVYVVPAEPNTNLVHRLKWLCAWNWVDNDKFATLYVIFCHTLS